MITLQIKDHTVMPGKTIVEILDGDKLLGAIYPTENGIRLVSKYLDPSRVRGNLSHPPSLEIHLSKAAGEI